MTRAPNWSTIEFEVVMSRPDLSDQELAALLPQRTTGAVGVVRSGIHSYHSDMNTSMLSTMMKDRLARSQGEVTCPLCGLTF